MSQDDLDRAIDTAAERIIAREPGRALASRVMTRVREGDAPAPKRFVWAAAAASVFVCGVTAAALMYRAPQTIPSLPAAPSFAVARPPATVGPPIVMAPDVRAARSSRGASAAVGGAAAMELPADTSPIAALQTDPIVVAVIDVPRLEPVEPATIEALNIEQLTIEPIVASND
jgi:hypothetical protein